MATEVIRQSVRYYLPDSPAKDHFITNDFFNNTINCLLTNITELDSINAVTDNEISRKVVVAIMKPLHNFLELLLQQTIIN